MCNKKVERSKFAGCVSAPRRRGLRHNRWKSKMRTLSIKEIGLVNGGVQAAPVGSATAWGYFTSCMDYLSPNATLGAVFTFSSFIPVVGVYIGGAYAAYTAETAVVCAIGTIPYTQ